MKLTQKDFAAQATKVARDCSVFFFCGSDEASVQDAATRILSLLPDPGERWSSPAPNSPRCSKTGR
jgi:DNA polymerase-3 subunit delta